MAGGWYVAPDPTARTDFESRYQTAFCAQPTRLASLGYDAVALAALLSRDRGAAGLQSRGALENREGFAGSDGLFRFNANGAIERGLAIMEVRANTVTVLDAAPRRFAEQRQLGQASSAAILLASSAPARREREARRHRSATSALLRQPAQRLRHSTGLPRSASSARDLDALIDAQTHQQHFVGACSLGQSALRSIQPMPCLVARASM